MPYTLKTFKNSSPTLSEPPTESVFGILLTKISSITLLLAFTAFIDFPILIVSVLTPTTKVFVKFLTDVDKPETVKESLSSNSKNGKQLAWTSLLLFHVNTTLSNLSRVVVIFDIPIPIISFTSALNPLPFVSVSSNSVTSPTLYPLPGLSICKLSTPPFVTDKISLDCLISSLDSIIKSFSACSSPTE